jgi:flavodoxin II
MTSPQRKIGLFYGSSTCYTEMAAEKIRDYIGEEKVDLHNVADIDVEAFNDYQFLLLGIPTWDYGELQEDWEAIWDDLDTIDFSSKHIALFGLGDQVGYPQWFQDAMGYLHDKLVARGALPHGYWPVQNYTFDESQALTEDKSHFVGLALDEENEFEQSQERIETWCDAILSAFDEQII